MKRSSEAYDLRKTNDRAQQKRKQMNDYHRRITKRRNRRRQLDLLVAGIGRGWLR